MNKRDRMIACEMIRQGFVKTGKYQNWRNQHSQDFEFRSETALDVKELFDSRLPKVINKVNSHFLFENLIPWYIFLSQNLLAQLSLSPAPWRKQHFDRNSLSIANSDSGIKHNFQKMYRWPFTSFILELDGKDSPTCSESQSHFGYFSRQDRSRWVGIRLLEQLLIYWYSMNILIHESFKWRDDSLDLVLRMIN